MTKEQIITKKFVLGNINEISIYDAWNSKKMREMRQIQIEGRFKENPTCAMCVKYTYPTKKFVSSEGFNNQKRMKKKKVYC